MGNLPDGVFLLRTEHPRFETAIRQGVPRGAVDADLVLRRRAPQIRGVVSDPGGERPAWAFRILAYFLEDAEGRSRDGRYPSDRGARPRDLRVRCRGRRHVLAGAPVNIDQEVIRLFGDIGHAKAVTNADGRFAFSLVSAGMHTVWSEVEGHGGVSAEVEVPAGGTVRVDLVLGDR